MFVDLKYDGVEGGLCLLDLQNFKSGADDSHKEDRCHDGDDKNDVGGICGQLSRRGVIFIIYDLHDGEEDQVKVCQHVESDVCIVLIL